MWEKIIFAMWIAETLIDQLIVWLIDWCSANQAENDKDRDSALLELAENLSEEDKEFIRRMDRKRKKGGKDKEEEEEIDEMEKGAMDRIYAENDRLVLRNVSRHKITIVAVIWDFQNVQKLQINIEFCPIFKFMNSLGSVTFCLLHLRPNLMNLTRVSKMVGSNWKCIQYFEI